MKQIVLIYAAINDSLNGFTRWIEIHDFNRVYVKAANKLKIYRNSF